MRTSVTTAHQEKLQGDLSIYRGENRANRNSTATLTDVKTLIIVGGVHRGFNLQLHCVVLFSCRSHESESKYLCTFLEYGITAC
jgi:hypothetical protein